MRRARDQGRPADAGWTERRNHKALSSPARRGVAWRRPLGVLWRRGIMTCRTVPYRCMRCEAGALNTGPGNKVVCRGPLVGCMFCKDPTPRVSVCGAARPYGCAATKAWRHNAALVGVQTHRVCVRDMPGPVGQPAVITTVPTWAGAGWRSWRRAYRVTSTFSHRPTHTDTILKVVTPALLRTPLTPRWVSAHVPHGATRRWVHPGLVLFTRVLQVCLCARYATATVRPHPYRNGTAPGCRRCGVHTCPAAAAVRWLQVWTLRWPRVASHATLAATITTIHATQIPCNWQVLSDVRSRPCG